ncbi:MAG: hypothetical protein ACP5E3_02685 [Bacteroidales bacterium]
MKSIYRIILIIGILLSSIFQLFSQTSVFDAGIENCKKLPSMNIEIDDKILARSYITREVFSAQEFQNEETMSQYYSTVFIEDTKVTDAMKILTRYLEKDLLSQKEESEAILRLNLVYYDYNFQETAGAFFNVITLATGNLLGIPNFKSETVVELELQIVNKDNQVISDYTSNVKKKSFRGLYYKKKDERECNQIALKRALVILNEQLMQDYDKIMLELK